MKKNKGFAALLFVIFVCPEILLGGICYFSGFTPIMQFLLGGVVFLQTLVFVFIITAPLTAGIFVSTVEKPKHIPLLPLFAAVENGRSKAVVDQGGNATRYVINKHDAGFHLKKELDGVSSEDNMWNVVEGEYSNARNFWEQKIEEKTGLVFVGVFPWRRVYQYELHPIKMLTKGGTRTLVISEKSETSDHVRVREFNWGAQVTVLLKDMFQVSILFSFRLQCVNPHKLLFGVDNWDESFADAVASRTIETLQNFKLEDLTKLGTDVTKSMIAESVSKISLEIEPKTEVHWGLKVIETQISKYEFLALTDEERNALTIVEVTKRKMDARTIEYQTEKQGEKDVVGARAEAIEAHGVAGMQASRDQMLETASANEGQQTIITGLSNGQPSEEGEIVKLLKALLAKK